MIPSAAVYTDGRPGQSAVAAAGAVAVVVTLDSVADTLERPGCRRNTAMPADTKALAAAIQ